MTELRRPSDVAIRTLVATDVETTFVVEAGAGTGKTELLVDRYVACLLRGGAAVDAVVAITFTEKAAGELRQRIRGRLDALLGAGDTPEPQRERVERALDGLDQAPISTIHAFAARLLRELPVEAGIDPGFTQLDEFQSRLVLDRAWQGWLDRVLDDDDRAAASEILVEVFDAGVALSDLEALCRERFRHRHELDDRPGVAAAPDLEAAIADLKRRARDLRERAAECSDPADKLLVTVLDLCAALDELPATGATHRLGRSLTALAVRRRDFARANAGRAASWPGGKDEMLGARDAALEAVSDAVASYGDYVARRCLALAHDFTAHAVETYRRAGVLDFDDLLGKARDLLRGGSAAQQVARRHFQRRFAYLLVDEFQDTDPLQAEIVLFLAEDGARATDWRQVHLTPGKLFLVGDPKQSIYRFRRADIATYQDVTALVESQGGSVLRLRQNFRSVASLVGFVNEVFGEVIGRRPVPHLQPDYIDLDAWRDDADDATAVVVLHPAEVPEKLRADDLRRLEAQAIAGLLAEVAAGHWTIPDGRLGSRPARLDDVAILFPTFTGIEAYERELRDAAIAYRLEGGSTYFARDEVAHVVAALRAVDEIADPVAVYGALRSSLFGFSDDDLFAFSRAGGAFDCFAGQPPAETQISAAMDMLAELHRGRDARPCADTLDELLRRTCYLEVVAAASDQPAQAAANLAKLQRLAAACDAQRGMTYHQFIRLLRDQVEQGDQVSVVSDQADSGALLSTIHKAKGLQFPIVVLANAASAPRRDAPAVLLDRDARRLECSLPARWLAGGAEVVRCRTSGYEAASAREAEALEYERRRLLYVAVTRAADVFAVPVVAWPDKDGPLLGWLAPHLGRDGVSSAAVSHRTPAPPGGAAQQRRPAAPDLEVLLQARARFVAARDELVSRARRHPVVTSPSALEATTPAAGASGAGRRRALAIGSSVHRVLELAELDGVPDLDELARLAAAEFGVGGDAGRVARLATACWASAPVRAAASVRHARELPLTFEHEGVRVEGVIDLAYETSDGWVLVDYKTDSAPAAATITARYLAQAGAYVVGFEAATTRPVRQFVFVLAAEASTGAPTAVAATLVIDVDEGLRAAAKARIGEATRTG